MKSMMLKGLIMVSTFAFMSCDESTIAAPGPETGMNPESSAALSPESSAAVGLESSAAVNLEPGTGVAPESSAAIDPQSSAAVNPQSSAVAGPESSAAVPPASSSSEVANPQSSSSEAVPVVSSSSEEPKPDGIFLSDDTDENKNYMEVEYIKNTADNGGGVLCYPKRLSDTKKHGVILWGPGGGSNPNDYEGIIRRLASHGFVVVATSESPDGTGRGIPALNWLEKKSTTQGDPLFG